MRALSLCACCRHYPGAATGRRSRSSHPAVTAFPDNVVGSACTSSFSRPAQRSLALRPAHSRGHLYVTCYTEGFSHFVTSMTAPVASGWSDLAGWGLHPLESAALSRRAREADLADPGLGRPNGRIVRLQGLPREESVPKPPFHCEREMRFPRQHCGRGARRRPCNRARPETVSRRAGLPANSLDDRRRTSNPGFARDIHQ